MLEKLFSARSVPGEKPRADNGLFMYGMPTAGTPVTEDRALTYSAFWACVKIISETIALMSWRVHEEKGRYRYVANEHSLDNVIRRRPNPEMPSFIFREVLTSHCLASGNGYAEIERFKYKPGNNVAALWPIHWDAVNPDRDSRGRLWYDTTAGGVNKAIKAENMLHVRGPSPDGLVGWSVVRMAKESISLGLAAEEFGSAFFGNGANLGGIIYDENGTSNLGEPGVKNLMRKFNARHRLAKNAKKVQFLDKGLKYQPIGVPPEEAQFLETRKFQLKEMCRWFRMPPHKLADLERSTHNNIESQNIEFVTDAVLPWAVRWEQEADFKLLAADEGKFYTKLNIASLLRGDSKARGEFYKLMWGLGAYSIDDILIKEDQNPLEDGSGALRMVPMNMVSVERAYREGSTGKSAEPSAGAKGAFLNVATRLTRIESKRLEQAATKKGDAPIHALNEFYGQFLRQVQESFEPHVNWFCEQHGAKVSANEFLEDWVMTSRDQAIRSIHESKAPALVQRWDACKALQLTEGLITYLMKGCK